MQCGNFLLLRIIGMATLIYSCVGTVYKYAEVFYNISKEGSDYHYRPYDQVHLVRVPKASSTSLSAVARRMAGCSPPGPCCKWPGAPAGSCPSHDLFGCALNEKVLGCVNHFPKPEHLMNQSIPSITMVREPLSRAISAFFYPGMHHNDGCTKKKTADECFVEYSNNKKWQNIAVKMFTGAFAYADVKVCDKGKDCANSLEKAISNIDKYAFVGISELWELSMLLLHKRMPQFKPSYEEFASGGKGGRRRLSYAGPTSENVFFGEDSLDTSFTANIADFDTYEGMNFMWDEQFEIDLETLSPLERAQFNKENEKESDLEIKRSLFTEEGEVPVEPSATSTPVGNVLNRLHNKHKTGMKRAGFPLKPGTAAEADPGHGQVAGARVSTKVNPPNVTSTLLGIKSPSAFTKNPKNNTVSPAKTRPNVNIAAPATGRGETEGQLMRENVNADYTAFKETAREKFRVQLAVQSKFDIPLYEAVVDHFCAQLHHTGLWNYTEVREYWQLKKFSSSQCP